MLTNHKDREAAAKRKVRRDWLFWACCNLSILSSFGLAITNHVAFIAGATFFGAAAVNLYRK